jgi:gliding motility-associated-like protein
LFSYFVAGATATSAISQPVGAYNIPNLLGGIYSVLVADEISGCLVSQSVTVSDPANTLSAPNLTTCSTDPIAAVTDANTIPSPGTFTYSVFDNTGTQVDNGTASTANFITNPLPAGIYSMQVTRATCVVGVSNITITQNPVVTFTPANNACIATPTITGSPAINYSWTGADASSTAVIQSQTTSTLSLNNVAGTYNYNMTGNDGVSCPSTVLVTITLDGITNPTINPFDTCQNPTILSASPVKPGYNYQWLVNGALNPGLFGSQIALGVTGTTDNYQVQIISPLTGCTFTSTPATSVKVIGPITAALASTAACDDGGAFNITATTSAVSPVYSWFRDTGTGFSTINVTTASTSQTTAGNYRVHIDDGPCSAEATIQLIKAPLPVGALPDRVIICDDPENADPTTDHYDLDPGVFAGYDWFIKKTEASPETSLGSTSQVFTADNKGIYRVELLNSFGCTADDFTEVLNDCVPKIIAPNAFRPASSVGANQNFFAKTFFITDDFKVFIYNRWGELVYQSGDRLFEWNGGYNNDSGNPLPSGAYAYIIQYVSSFRPDEGTQEKRGGVMLVR